jgi:nucleoside-diphosphate-sugar epimerase
MATQAQAGRLLVITGAAGRIGSFYRNRLRQQHAAGAAGTGDQPWRLRLVDVRPPENASPDDDVLTGDAAADLADLDVARRAVAGAHSVLHLAADPSPRADFYASLLDRNVKATYNVLHAALEAGVKRVVFASSINAVNGYPDDVQVRAEDRAWPGNVYGASKAGGEAICGAFVAQSKGQLSAIAVRIGGVTKREDLTSGRRGNNWLSITVTYEDLSRLFDCCLDGAPDVSFAVVNGTSANRHLRMDLESTRRLVGYQPQDDAFAMVEQAPSQG